MTVLSNGHGQVFSRAELLAQGVRPRQITRAVARGTLVRLRRDRYAVDAHPGIARAVRVGGRLCCVSLLAHLGVFVLDASALHVHLESSMSRLRSPDDRQRAMSARDRSSLRLHWWPCHEPHASLAAVSLFDAVAQAIRCQEPRAAVATVDSALQLGLLSKAEMRAVFAALPRRYLVVLALADASAESGSESLMRLILRQLGLRFETQVVIPGVRRVDFLVEGWLIIECDSKAHHEGWEKQRRDRRRDLAAAKLGYTTLRPLAEDIFFDRATVAAAVRGIVRVRGRRMPR